MRIQIDSFLLYAQVTNEPLKCLRNTGTIRRFLEQQCQEVIVLCLEPHERGIYEVLAPLYFPRDKLEEKTALWQLPKDIGGPYGEPQQFDRQIRIIRNPQHCVMMQGKERRIAHFYSIDHSSLSTAPSGAPSAARLPSDSVALPRIELETCTVSP